MVKIIYPSKEKKKKRKTEHQRFLTFIRRKNPGKYKRMMFNYNFLIKMRNIYSNLHCVYCNKNLKIYPFSFVQKRRGDTATADHFLPKFLYPDLEFKEKNLRVSCSSCNSKKGHELWDEKFPYKKHEK